MLDFILTFLKDVENCVKQESIYLTLTSYSSRIVESPRGFLREMLIA